MTKAPLVVCANSSEDVASLKWKYSDATAVRIPIYRLKTLQTAGWGNAALWVDTAFDGFPEFSDDSSFWSYFKGVPGSDIMRSSAESGVSRKQSLEAFVAHVLDDCVKSGAAWITVPQLAQSTGSDRNKTNKLLAQATATWKARSHFRGSLVLPVIFTAKAQVVGKSAWGPKVQNAARLCQDIGCDAMWVVDASLADWRGTADFETRRFPELIRIHEELRTAVGSHTTIMGGPYWGMNLVLWVRGVTDCPVVALGTGYQYLVAGGVANQPKARIVLPPLRRFASLSQGLRGWLKHPASGPGGAAEQVPDLTAISDRFDDLALSWKRQIVEEYRSWIDKLLLTPSAGRALSLYQDLSTAFVLGSKLKDIPGEKGRERRPELPARQLMLNCL